MVGHRIPLRLPPSMMARSKSLSAEWSHCEEGMVSLTPGRGLGIVWMGFGNARRLLGRVWLFVVGRKKDEVEMEVDILFLKGIGAVTILQGVGHSLRSFPATITAKYTSSRLSRRGRREK